MLQDEPNKKSSKQAEARGRVCVALIFPSSIPFNLGEVMQCARTKFQLFRSARVSSRPYVLPKMMPSASNLCDFTGRCPAWPGGLNLLGPRLVESYTTVIIPFDHRFIFVNLLNCAEFSSRLSKVAQTLDAISGFQFLIDGRGFRER
jgi:hypothetical protein